VNDEDLGVPGNTHGSLVHRFFGVAGFWWLKDNYVESSAIAENSLDLSTGVLLTVHKLLDRRLVERYDHPPGS
jgi:hypothetical protein